MISEIFEKDIRRRVKVRHVSVFQKVQTYLINNFGATTSLTKMLAALEKYARSHGYAVSIGRIGTLECDFILRHGDTQYAYVQTCMTMSNAPATEDREYAPLEKKGNRTF